MKKFFSIIFIILIASVLRLYQLDKIPPSLDWDEAALGYNAYSLWQTGKDEFGNFLPLALRSFDDYKPPLYAYVTAPFVGIFGLNETTTRLPSAIAGILTVILTYFLTKEIFQSRAGGASAPASALSARQSALLATLAASLLAISPWHIQFSRGAFEANFALFLVVLGITAFIKRGWFLIIGVISFGLSLYAYLSARVFSPLMLGFLLFYFWYKKELNTKISTILVLCFLAISLPIIVLMTGKQGLGRLSGTSVLTNNLVLLQDSKIKADADTENSDFLPAKIFHSPKIAIGRKILENYFSNFDLNYLFIDAKDVARHHAPGMGLLYWWQLPLIIIGLIYLIKNRPGYWSIVFAWLLIAPIAAAPTWENPHAIRTLVMVPIYQILTACGLYNFYNIYKNYKYYKRIVIFSGFIFFFLFNFLYFLDAYFVHMPREYAKFWQYGYKQAVEEIVARQDNYDRIYVSTKLEQPYIFFLFYSRYNPKKYLQNGGTKIIDSGSEDFCVEKVCFTKVKEEMFQESKRLFIGLPEEFKSRQEIVARIKTPDGEEIIDVAETY